MDPAPLHPSLPRALGEFRIESILGEGGSGIVYDATWGPRRVALKVLHEALADSERVRAQFLAEAQRLQQIAHSSVVKVLSFGELPDKRPYLAMERLEGETLAAVLAKGPMPLAYALELFGELCGAVGALHDQGLIHRDLKPENVFIVAGKHAVLLDFGIAKDLAAPSSTTTMEGGVRGTPAYMAPERFFGQPAALATDIYELAVTLYAMLAGRLPWDDLADPEARLSPRALVDLAPVPDELDVEIRRALSTRAQNRPASASVFLEAVRAAAGSHTPTAAETARMRPASEAALVAQVTKSDASRKQTGPRQPWFAERQATTDRGKTPLAWAPSPQTTEAAPPTARAKKWPLVLGALAAVALAGGVVAWRLAREEAATPPAAALAPAAAMPAVAPENDPWDRGPRAPAPTKEIAASEPEIAADAARTEAHAAIAHLPADTAMVIGALVGPLRRDQRFAPIFERAGTSPQVKALLVDVPACVKSMVADAEWFVFGSSGFNAQEQGTLIVRGRWTRASIEECFEDQAETRKMADGETILQLPSIGWVDFIDEHTAYISVRQDLTAAQVHANVKGAKPLSTSMLALLAKLPEDRMLTFAVDGKTAPQWPKDTLPYGSDVVAWFRPLQDGGVAFDVAMNTKDEPAAKELQKKLATEISTVFGEATKGIADIRVERDKARVRLGGTVSSMILGLATAAIPQ